MIEITTAFYIYLFIYLFIYAPKQRNNKIIELTLIRCLSRPSEIREELIIKKMEYFNHLSSFISRLLFQLEKRMSLYKKKTLNMISEQKILYNEKFYKKRSFLTVQIIVIWKVQ